MRNRIALATALLLGTSTVAMAQSSPNLVYGQVPSAAQWNSYFAAKQDYSPTLSAIANGSTPVSIFTSSQSGTVPASGGGATNFLRADGTWAAPAGGGAVDSVFGRTGVVTAQSGDYSVGQVTGAAPLASPTFTGTVTLSNGAILGTPASGNASNLTNIPVANATGVLPAVNGGAGSVSGLLKANGSGTVSAAVSGTDYAPPTSGSSILYGNGSGGFSSVTVGTGLDFTGGTLTATGAGSGNVTISPTSGNVAGDLVTMSNTTTGVEDSGVAVADVVTINGTQTLTSKTIDGQDNTLLNVDTSSLSNVVNYQTGTSYTVLATDGGASVVHSNAATITETLPQATGSFTTGFGYRESNVGAGVLNISTTTSTFPNGGTSLPSMMTGQAADIESVNGNYSVLMGLPVVPADYLIGNFSGSANYPTAAALVNCANDGAHGLVYSTSTHSFACASISGGGGSPGGSDTQIQYNNSGSFGGISAFTWDGTTIISSGNGTQTAAAVSITGTPGTGTNAEPLFSINAAGSTQRTNRNTNGTMFGINAPNGFTGNILDFSNNGGQGVPFFTLGPTGVLTVSNNLFTGATSYYYWTSRSRLGSSANGVITMQTNNGADFTQLNWGPTSSSFVGIKKINGTTLGVRIADDSADGSLTMLNATLSGVLQMPQTTWANNQTCTAGQIAADADYIYVCTATNTVKRVALSTF